MLRRRYQAELEKEMRHFQLLQLKETSRPFAWRRIMQRMADCFFAWRDFVIYPRFNSAAIVIQTFCRCHMARHRYKSILGKIKALSQIVKIRLARNTFTRWYCNARWLHCLKIKERVFGSGMKLQGVDAFVGSDAQNVACEQGSVAPISVDENLGLYTLG